MFQACDVKIAKIAAHSTPSSRPGNSAMKPVTVTDRKPRIGTDCRMSSTGIRIFSACRLLAASARVGEAEDQRGDQRRDHAQHGAQRVFRQAPRVEADRQRLAEFVARAHREAAPRDESQSPEHQRQRHEIPGVRAQPRRPGDQGQTPALLHPASHPGSPVAAATRYSPRSGRARGWRALFGCTAPHRPAHRVLPSWRDALRRPRAPSYSGHGSA